MRRHKGLLPGPVSYRTDALEHAEISGRLVSGLRGSADLSGKLPAVFDQAECEGCWAHALANIVGAVTGHLASPLYFMQSNYARLRGIANPTGNLPPLYDGGSQLSDAAASAAQLGWLPYQAPQQNGGTDVPATIDMRGNAVPLPELTPDQVATGMGETFAGEYAITADGVAADVLAAALEAGIYVWDGFEVDDACENLKAGHVLGAPTGPNLGGHSTLYWGYETLSDGSRVFHKRNSWGKSWCDGGDYLVNDAHVAAAWALWPMPIRVAS